MYLNKDYLTKFFFKCFIIFLPFDSFPIPFLNTVYRPLSILSVLSIFLLHLKYFIPSRKINIFLFTVLFFIFFISIFNSFYLNIYDGLFKFLFELFILYITYKSLIICYFNIKRDDFNLIIKQSIDIVIKLFLIIGILQLLSRFFSTFNYITSLINSFILYRSDISRIQFYSGEPAMGFRMVILFLSLNIFINKGLSISKINILLISLLLLLSGSTFGIFYLFLYFFSILFIYCIYNKIKIYYFFKYFLILFLSTVLFYIFLFDLLPYYTQNKINISLNIIKSLSFDKLLFYSQRDGSLFLRIFNPIIGYKMFLDNWVFGIGGENYQYYYLNYIIKYYNYALSYNSVIDVFITKNSITPKSLIIKLLCEFGLIGFFICFYLFRNVVFIAKKSYFIYPLASYFIVTTINYDSYIYMPLIFTFFILNYHKNYD
jgi:hypothetical protein